MKYFLVLLAVLSAAILQAAPEIRVQGFNGVYWTTINAGDLNPDQTVTKFGTVDFGESETRRYRVQNRGNQNLIVRSYSSDASEFTFPGAPTGSFTIAANDEAEFQVKFTPTKVSQTATITVKSTDSSTGLYSFAVAGNGQGPEINLRGRATESAPFISIPDGELTPSASRGTLFSDVQVGEFAEAYFEIENLGNKGLSIQTPTITGTDNGMFEVRNLSTLTNIGGGNNRTFRIRYSPTSVGTHTVSFNIASNDLDEGFYNFRLQGNAIGQPTFRMQGRASGIFNDIENNDMTPDQTVTNFGDMEPGYPVTRTYRIKNEGNSHLVVANPVISNPMFSTNFGQYTINAGSDYQFTITFVPTVIGDTVSTISFQSNAGEFRFAIAGSGDAPSALIVNDEEASILPNSANSPSAANGTLFAETEVGTEASPLSLRITNTGTRRLDYPWKLKVTPSTDFQIYHDPIVRGYAGLQPGSEFPFEVRFTPTGTGVREAVVTLESDDPFKPVYSFTVRGLGAPPPTDRTLVVIGKNGSVISSGSQVISVATGTNLGTTPAGSSTLTSTFSFRNDGEADLNITGVSIEGFSFTYNQEAFPAVLESGESVSFPISLFASREPSVVSTIVTVSSNDPDVPSYQFSIRGTVTEPAPPGISTITMGDGVLNLMIEATDNLYYALESSLSLEDGSWSKVPGYEHFRLGPQTWNIELSEYAEVPQAFFRVVRSAPEQ